MMFLRPFSKSPMQIARNILQSDGRHAATILVPFWLSIMKGPKAGRGVENVSDHLCLQHALVRAEQPETLARKSTGGGIIVRQIAKELEVGDTATVFDPVRGKKCAGAENQNDNKGATEARSERSRRFWRGKHAGGLPFNWHAEFEWSHGEERFGFNQWAPFASS